MFLLSVPSLCSVPLNRLSMLPILTFAPGMSSPPSSYGDTEAQTEPKT